MDGIEPQILVDEEASEGKALAAYLAGEITAADLRVSLGVSRVHMYRLIARYRQSGQHGSTSKEYDKRNRARAEADG